MEHLLELAVHLSTRIVYDWSITFSSLLFTRPNLQLELVALQLEQVVPHNHDAGMQLERHYSYWSYLFSTHKGIVLLDFFYIGPRLLTGASHWLH